MMGEREKIGVLFVCLGNICRSPLAMGVFRAVVEEEGLQDRFEIDSAGTSSYHIGEPPDSRTTAVARQRGVRIDHRARQVRPGDLDRFEYVLAMDRENLDKLERLTQSAPARAEVRLLLEFDEESGDRIEVPDPYYGGPRGFEDVHDMVERACRGLLEHIRRERL